jgi:hypothetical protein
MELLNYQLQLEVRFDLMVTHGFRSGDKLNPDNNLEKLGKWLDSVL